MINNDNNKIIIITKRQQLKQDFLFKRKVSAACFLLLFLTRGYLQANISQYKVNLGKI